MKLKEIKEILDDEQNATGKVDCLRYFPFKTIFLMTFPNFKVKEKMSG